ncbi:MAG: Hsp20/alpha crystallin family protein [Brevinematales bacterium]|nr:Hsp20/alpha crystallin family protein [Brevinematales bacterium]
MLFNPFYEVEKMKDFMDEFLKEYLEGSKRYGYDYSNIYEGKDGYILQFIAPGVELKDIDINISNGILNVNVKRKVEIDKDKRLLRNERYDIDFTKSFKISEDADVGKIDAKLMNGLLMIYIPKKEEAKPKKISIKVE